MLFVGSIFQRRHVDRLIDAFDRRRRPRAATPARDRRREPHASPRARSRCDSRAAAAHARSHRASARTSTTPTLATLYGRASVFAFLSEYEGFGLTPLEALPPACRRSSSIRRWRARSTAPAARYVAPLRIRRARSPAALARSADQRATRARRSCASAPSVLARYDWNATAAATLAALEEAAGAR